MATKTLPLDMDLTVYYGTTLRQEFRWLPDGTNPAANFNTWNALLLIGPRGGAALREIVTASARLEPAPVPYDVTVDDNGGACVNTRSRLRLTTDGRILIDIPPSNLAGLPRGDLFYVLDLTDPAGYTCRFLRGKIKVIRDVSRASGE